MPLVDKIRRLLFRTLKKSQLLRSHNRYNNSDSVALQSAALDKVHTAKYVTAKKTLPSAIFPALDEPFAKCQKALGKIK